MANEEHVERTVHVAELMPEAVRLRIRYEDVLLRYVLYKSKLALSLDNWISAVEMADLKKEGKVAHKRRVQNFIFSFHHEFLSFFSGKFKSHLIARLKSGERPSFALEQKKPLALLTFLVDLVYNDRSSDYLEDHKKKLDEQSHKKA